MYNHLSFVHLPLNPKIMSKKKKKKKFPHLVSVDYLGAVADKLHGMNPSKQIVLNTITDVWKEGYNRGYQRRQDEIVRFRQKRDKSIETEFNKFKDELDDMIYIKNQTIK